MSITTVPLAPSSPIRLWSSASSATPASCTALTSPVRSTPLAAAFDQCNYTGKALVHAEEDHIPHLGPVVVLLSAAAVTVERNRPPRRLLGPPTTSRSS